MDVLDISFSHIKINSPIQHENDLYEFPLDYDDKPFLFSSKQKYGLHQGDSIYQLHIQDKNELIFFSNLRTYKFYYIINFIFDFTVGFNIFSIFWLTF